MPTRLEKTKVLGVVADGAMGPSRSELLIALVDRARLDQAFSAELQREMIAHEAGTELSLDDVDWNRVRGLRSV